MDPKDQKPDDKSPLAMAGVGFEFVTSILVFVLGGYFLDEKFDTSPLWLLVGLFGGFGYSFYILIKRTKDL